MSVFFDVGVRDTLRDFSNGVLDGYESWWTVSSSDRKSWRAYRYQGSTASRGVDTQGELGPLDGHDCLAY